MKTTNVFQEGNLYIGTSAAEVLHYFQLPPADDDDVSQQFILATRLQPHFAENVSPAQRVGVQQILILANVSKACILCNGTLTFYTLPELSPLFTNTKLNNCLSVGGVDEGGVEPGDDNDDGMVIMICQKSRIRLVRIGERLQRVREIEAGGCLDTLRRGSIACVADHKSYYLLDVVERQRIPLFEISSSADDSNAEPDTRSSPQATGELVRPSLAVSSLAPGDTAGQSHSRTVSSASIPQHEEQQPRKSSTQLSHTLEEPPPRRSSLQPPPADASRAHSRTPSQDIASHRTPNILMPHIASPSPSEFLLTTGTSLDEPGVGMFVNSDGDVVRGTLEFSRYPEALCIDGQKAAADEGATEQDQFVLAIVTKIADGQSSKELEIHNLDQSADSVNSGRFNLQVVGDMLASRSHPQNSFGIRPVSSDFELRDSRVRDLLSLKRLTLPNDDEGSGDTTSTNAEREKQEAQFINRLSSTKCKTIVWGIDKLWWTCRNPALVRLHARLQLAMGQFKDSKTGETNRKLVGQVITDIEGEEPTTELEFLTIRLVRQEASLMLFLDVLQQSFNKLRLNERGRNLIEQALSDGEIDPRLVLSVIPALWQEVAQGTNGIWISGALKTLLEDFRSKHDMSQARTIVDLDSPGTKDVLQLVRGYLLLWRLKKGFGSVADEKEVFETVDAALLHVYLLLDGDSPKGPGRRDSTRSELNAVVDSGLDCFDRAVELLEEHRRLYVLSRLYQSRKMSTKVLGTWRRILEGEEDAGGELTDGEQEMRRYLAVVSNPALVEEYGAWLAARNPKIGVRVFADGNSKVKFEPKRAVEILKQHAPNAVKDYLEYLVFDRNVSRVILIRITDSTNRTSSLFTPPISSPTTSTPSSTNSSHLKTLAPTCSRHTHRTLPFARPSPHTANSPPTTPSRQTGGVIVFDCSSFLAAVTAQHHNMIFLVS